MSDFFIFAGAHPIVTFFLAWSIWPICWMAQAVLTAPFRFAYLAYLRRQRALNIHTHGWPPHPLMNADGNIIHPPVADV